MKVTLPKEKHLAYKYLKTFFFYNNFGAVAVGVTVVEVKQISNYNK